ncbi:MAG: DUF3419 family protein [Bdellovibrionota bacterium]
MTDIYFQNLNYTLANEDTSLELAILPENVDHVLSVAGSGGRVLPLLAKRPKLLTCVDISKQQLQLTELRIESARKLNHKEFLGFWGYPPHPAAPEERQDLFHDLKLSKPARSFFYALFKHKKWESILYDGKWERTFAKLAWLNRKITGASGAGLFTALSKSEHNAYLKNQFPHTAWALVLFLLGNANVFNALLYKGQFPRKNIPHSFFRHYHAAFSRLFNQGPARRNFFLQMVFFGKVIFGEGCPIECDAEIFAKTKKALTKTEVRYLQGDIVHEAATSRDKIDFLSLSDAPSYFQGEKERSFLQQVSKNLSPRAITVIRNYLHLPEGLNTNGFERITENYSDAISSEKVQVYTPEIYRWSP